MLLDNKTAKRAGIYFFFDQQGVVDDYNIYMLNGIRPSLEKLLVVVNGSVNSEGRAKFEAVADRVLVRDNAGFDVWAYKEGMDCLGWDYVRTLDELIQFNFTNYGPVYPLGTMFEEMAGRDVDFWGITRHHGHDFDPYKKCKYGRIPAHIQSSFIAVRRNMLNADSFTAYWREMPMICSYEEAICYHEAIFTEDFTRQGFASDTYVNTDDLAQYAPYPLILYARELVENRKCPIFKRKSFMNIYDEFLDISCGQSTLELYEYIKNNTDYDVNLIWDNLLRTSNMYDIKNRMQLNYVLPADFVKLPLPRLPKVALFMHIYSLDMLDTCRSYADNMPLFADIYVSTSSPEKKKAIEASFEGLSGRKVTVVAVENRGREYSGIFIGLKPYFRQYDYICIAHSKKSEYDRPYMIGQSFAYKCFENTLASRAFTENVISLFEQNHRLGMLVPPPPNHGPYYLLIGKEWQNDYENVKNIAQQWNLNVDIDKDKPPIAPYGNFFWFRASALALIFDRNFTYDDFPPEPLQSIDGSFMHALERIYPFAAQQSGFYTGWLISDVFAKMELTNLNVMLRDVNIALYRQFDQHDRHDLLHMIESSGNIVSIISSNNGAFDKLKLLTRKILGNRMYVRIKSLYKRIMKRPRRK